MTVDGLVERPLELTLGELRGRPPHEVVATMECAGNGRAQARAARRQPAVAPGGGRHRALGGPRLRDLLGEAGVRRRPVEVLFTGLDRGIENGEEQWFQRSLPLAEALRDDVILAYDLNGAPLPPQHGFPLRLLVPGWYGMTNVKWLTRISVIDEPFRGYQQAQGLPPAARSRRAGRAARAHAPRALLEPPGIPEFMTRERTMTLGPCRLSRAGRGRARRRSPRST